MLTAPMPTLPSPMMPTFTASTIFLLYRIVLKNDAAFPVAAGDVFAVQVFEQRDGVLARHAGPILEVGDGEACALARGERLAQCVDRCGVIDQLVADANQLAILQQNLQEGSRSR